MVDEHPSKLELSEWMLDEKHIRLQRKIGITDYTQPTN
jgi:hypothetical protein